MFSKIVYWGLRQLSRSGPQGPRKGAIFYQTDTGLHKIFNGQRWVTLKDYVADED